MINVEKIFGKSLEFIDAVAADLENQVRIFTIPKRGGGNRTITAPSDDLKQLQQQINRKLLIHYHPEMPAHGFVRRRSIITNAKKHVGAKSMGKMDIASFFDTIGPNHIRNVLCGNKNVCRFCSHYPEMEAGRCSPSIYKNKGGKFVHKCDELKALFVDGYCDRTGYTSLLKRVLDLTTYRGSACQGFPTSPYLANIVMAGFDRAMKKLAQDNDCVYTRYADDMTFSSKTLDKDALRRVFENAVERKLYGFGFKVKKEKSKWKNSTGRLSSCGIVCNVKPNIAREKIMKFRAAVHRATVVEPHLTTPAVFNRLRGWCSFLSSVNPEVAHQYVVKLDGFAAAGPIPRPAPAKTVPETVYNDSDNYFKERVHV